MIRIAMPQDHNDTGERFKRTDDGLGDFPEEPLSRGLVALRLAMFTLSVIAIGILVWMLLE